MITSASSTLTAAMMPSRMLVVPSCSIGITSERVRLMMSRERCRAGPFAHGVVEDTPALRGHVDGPVHGSAKLQQLLREVLERRLDAPAKFAPAFREQHVSRDSPGYPADDRRHNRSLPVVHTASSPANLRLVFQLACHAQRTSRRKCVNVARESTG